MTAERPGRAWIRPLRLWCGLILFAYLLTHFSNHALGLISLRAMEAGRVWFLALWRNPVGETLLFGALLVHWLLALWLLYRRRTLRMPVWEATQIVFGLAVPPLLVSHIVGTRLANAMYGTEDLYTRIVLFLWVLDPWNFYRQTALFVVAWSHGCMGLHFWLRFRGWYPRFFPLVLSAFVLVPVLGYLGFAEAGREVSALAREPGFVQRLMVETRTPLPEQRATLQRVRDGLGYSTWALLLLTLLARGVRGYLSPRRAMVRVSYPDGRSVAVPVALRITGRSARSPCSLPIFAGSRASPSTSCPTTSSSSSIAISKRWGAPSPRPAASRTSTRVTASWRSSASRAGRRRPADKRCGRPRAWWTGCRGSAVHSEPSSSRRCASGSGFTRGRSS